MVLYAPSGDLNTLARGLTSEMKLIIADKGSDISCPPSCFAVSSLGSLEVRARRTRLKALVRGRPPPAAHLAATAGETDTDNAAELCII